jgi:hypothetical protein
LNHERFIGFSEASEGSRCCAPNQMTTPSARAQCRTCAVQTGRAAGNTQPIVFPEWLVPFVIVVVIVVVVVVVCLI